MRNFLWLAIAATVLLLEASPPAAAQLANVVASCPPTRATPYPVGTQALLAVDQNGNLCASASGGGSGTPGGTTGQVQYNNSGAFGGFTLGGDCTLSQPNITCTKTGGASFGALATSTDAANLSGTVASARVAGSYTGITGTGTLTAGATGAGFTVALATSTVTGALPAGNFPALTGDVTTTAGSLATAIGSTKVTSSMLNADVFTTAHSWSGQQTFTAPVLGVATATSVGFSGSSSGLVTVTGAANAGTWTLTLPTTDGNDGEVLKTNGSGVTSWVAVSASPGGSPGEVQYNNSSAFGGATGVTIAGSGQLTVTAATTGVYGFRHSSAMGETVLGTYTDGTNSWIGTQTNTSLIFFTADGSSSMALVPDGMGASKLGIGTDMPSEYLDVVGNIKASGSIIGTLAPTGTLELAASGYGFKQVDGTNMVTVTTYTDAVAGQLGTVTNHPLGFFTNDSGIQVLLTVDGKLGVGTVMPAETIEAMGNIKATGSLIATDATFTGLVADVGATDATVCVDSMSGALRYGSGTLGVCLGTSSARYKRDIEAQQEGLAQIVGLEPKTFRYIPGRGDGGAKRQHGFLAEDVADVLPGLVGLDAEGRPNSVDLVGMIPILVKAVQELRAEVERLRPKHARSN